MWHVKPGSEDGKFLASPQWIVTANTWQEAIAMVRERDIKAVKLEDEEGYTLLADFIGNASNPVLVLS